MTISLLANAQQRDTAPTGKTRILDDTTKLTYGPKSTTYTIEDDLKFNSPEYRIIDTTLFSSYRKNKVELYNYYYSNLGLDGSTLRFVFYHLPSNIGISPGQEGFAPFYRTPSDIRYYNTRSPYSRLTIFLGGSNRSITDVEFSRSDSVNFNFGFDFKTFKIDKQIERQGRGDRSVDATQYDFYTQVRSSNLKYQLLANLTRSRHIQYESGGIDTTGVGDFFSDDVTVFLRDATSDELRQGLHLYHQYSIKDYLEVYNTIASYRQRNEYIDKNLGNNADYYDQFLISDTETLDSTDYKQRQIEIGLKGRLDNFYYNGYLKQKNYDFINKYADSIPIPYDPKVLNRSGIENYFGFHSGYKFLKEMELLGGVEWLRGGNFESYVNFTGKNFNFSYRGGQYKPSFLQEAYFGNHRFWTNNFRPINSYSFQGEYALSLKRIVITPTIGYSEIENFIYFDRDTVPGQNLGNISIMSPGLKFKFEFLKRFVFDGNVVYTPQENLADSVIAIPEIFVYSRLYYRNIFFNGNLESFIGLDLNYKSAYYGNAYDPVTQQFYLQNHTLTDGFPVVNLFLNFKIRRANLFAKMNNLVQMVRGEGYIVAPLYRGLPPIFDFGVTFWFFD
jgi:hypothetical protein